MKHPLEKPMNKAQSLTARDEFLRESAHVAETLTAQDLRVVAKLLRNIADAGKWGQLKDHYVERANWDNAIEYHALPKFDPRWAEPFQEKRAKKRGYILVRVISKPENPKAA